MAKGRHIPPSRRRYEQSHPVIAIRVNEELYRKLQGIKVQANISFADILKQGLGMQEAATKKASYAGFHAGEIKGRKFHLGICTVCKEALYWDLNTEEHRQFLEKAINDSGFVHITCKK